MTIVANDSESDDRSLYGTYLAAFKSSTKSVVVDGTVSIIGSANLDMRSFLHNDEVNAIVISRDTAVRMEQVFQRDQQAARPVDLDKWKRRSLWQRTKEFFVNMFSYWI